jgi:hypothetical protein
LNQRNKNQKNSFDSYLKTKGEFFMNKKLQIRPSASFTEKTIAKIEAAHEHRILITKILIVTYMFIPFILREVWFFARRDYFTLSHWPLGHLLSSVYKLFISAPVATYMLILTIVSALIYLWGMKFLAPTFRYIGHFFGKGEQARA